MGIQGRVPFENPNGILSQSPGREARATLGLCPTKIPNRNAIPE